ncbi:hypothetical protein G6027_13475 [Dietzia sp. SLG310A2-38A2]|uniref:hypothetical protein n=1 Tax=Dietzia sp. SLG310A2-38A2 TaxID=1630643 RepID=UPI0015FC9E6F|nr:hypothetical protein [Dietzia sp. SLG310A2-38A2]MBB1031874.1 hypothetical protein [Dietzia sp. SLG310A2-38A2]
MYAWLYRSLPGPTPVRILLVLALLAAGFLLLMEVVFPAVESLMPYSDVAVDPVAAARTAI